MRKILFFIFPIFILLSIFFFIADITRAAGCKLKDLGPLAPDYNGPVTIEPEAGPGLPTDCFSSNQGYIVIFYPQNYNVDHSLMDIQTSTDYSMGGAGPSITITVPSFKVTAGSTTGPLLKLTGNLDLNKDRSISGSNTIVTVHGERNAKWEVIVCRGDTVNDCDTKSPKYSPLNIIAKGVLNLTDTAVAPPGGAKPPPGLPTIDILSQDLCLYKTGDNVVIKKVKTDYADPAVEYHWWWDGKRNYTPIGGSKNVSEFSITIPGACGGVNPSESCTGNLGNSTPRLCVDFTARSESKFYQNCINLTFQNQPISVGTNRSCSPDTRGSTEECTKDIVDRCAKENKLCNLGKCAASVSSSAKTCKDSGTIQTAIGCIHTDPALLLSDLFSFTPPIMGLIAFLMMVYSGIKMILSGGNPQAIGGARDMFINAVIGLLFALFSVLLLQILGADIFHLPGFTR